MTIKKTYVVQLSNHDGSIDHAYLKARSQAEAAMKAQDRYRNVAGVDVGTPSRLPEYHQFLHSWREADIFSQSRYGRLGKYLFQHKGHKRKGLKNYPTPAGGWRKPTAPITYTVCYSKDAREFFEGWLEALFPKEAVS